jgi:predicted TIM-barrel fold metal-dependent hydrolase
MPVVGAAAARELEPLLGRDCPIPGAQWLDVHTHTGQNDPDGIRGTDAELLAALDDAGIGHALVFTSHEPNGYREANDRVREEAARSGGRLDWLGRVDPNADDALEEARRCLDLGARGIKLHPRSDRFGLPHPVVDAIATEVAARALVLLFHSGRGIPNLGDDCVLLAERHPELRVVLAHAGISDLGLLAPAAARLPNLLFDMAWWQVADLLALVTTIPPGRILFASDAPYGAPLLHAFFLRRVTAAAGWSSEQRAVAAGEQARRVLSSKALLDLGPATGRATLGARDAALERVVAYASAAAMVAWSIGREAAAEPTALARLGCQQVPGDPHAPLLRVCDRLLERAAKRIVDPQDDERAPIPALMAAAMLAGTPEAGTPEWDGT